MYLHLVTIRIVSILKVDQEIFLWTCFTHEITLKSTPIHSHLKLPEPLHRVERSSHGHDISRASLEARMKELLATSCGPGSQNTHRERNLQRNVLSTRPMIDTTCTELWRNSFLAGTDPWASFTLDSPSLYVLLWAFSNHQSEAPHSSLAIQAAPLRGCIRGKTYCPPCPVALRCNYILRLFWLTVGLHSWSKRSC